MTHRDHTLTASPLSRTELWAARRWIVRRTAQTRGLGYPRWWRAARARRLEASSRR